MKLLTLTTAAVVAFVIPALAQDITSLPQCAQQPILNAISASGCPLTDIACICGNNNFVNGLLELIPTLCTPDEVAIVSEFSETLCIAYGVTLTLPDVVSGSPSTTASNSTATGAATSTSVSEAATTSASSSSESAATSSAAPASSSSVAASSTGTASASAAASSSPAAGAANANSVGYQALFGVAALGLAAVV